MQEFMEVFVLPNPYAEDSRGQQSIGEIRAFALST